MRIAYQHVPLRDEYSERTPEPLGIIQDLYTARLPVEVFDYVPIPPNDPQRRFRHGTVLFQYDPQEEVPGTNEKIALVRMYLDSQPLDDVTWEPLAHQIPPPKKAR